MYEVDDESFDVTPVVVLISHNHQSTVAKSFNTFVNFFELKTHNFHNILDLDVNKGYGVVLLGFQWFV